MSKCYDCTVPENLRRMASKVVGDCTCMCNIRKTSTIEHLGVVSQDGELHIVRFFRVGTSVKITDEDSGQESLVSENGFSKMYVPMSVEKAKKSRMYAGRAHQSAIHSNR